jgi:arylsulfatase A-like enzyme
MIPYRQISRLCSIISLIAIASRPLPADELPVDRPNFIILLSDDQNWDGLSVQMAPHMEESRNLLVHTPNLAALAEEGMRFSRGYSSSPVCAPSRAGILTGMTPAALQWTKAGPIIQPGSDYPLIPPESIKDIPGEYETIAERLSQAGYATAHYGKWHLGGGGPEAHGYEESDGDTSNKDAAPFLPPNPVDIFGMGNRAISFMEKAVSEDRPFYIQMSYHALHYPQNALPQSISLSRSLMEGANEKEILRNAIAHDLDRGIGELLKKMREMGLDDSTYVVYMSDNGGSGGKGHILQGGKGTLREGGIRVPFIIRGPGISPGSFCSTPVAGHDLLPTFSALAGIEDPLPATVEGGDFSSLLFGYGNDVKRKYPGLAFHFPHYQGETPQSALIMDQYKLIYHYEDNRTELYDIYNDPGERKNLSLIQPGKTEELLSILKQYLNEVNASVPIRNPDF